MEGRRGLAMRFLSVHLFVRPSVKRVDCDKTKEKSVQIFIPCERSFTLVLWEKQFVWWGATPCTWTFGPTGRSWSEIADFEPIIARSASAVRPSEQVQLTLIGSRLHTCFPTSLRWSSYVAPKSPKGGSKTPFFLKIAFASQWLQWNIKLLTMFINWTNWAVWMYSVKAD